MNSVWFRFRMSYVLAVGARTSSSLFVPRNTNPLAKYARGNSRLRSPIMGARHRALLTHTPQFVTHCWKCDAEVQISIQLFPVSCNKCGCLHKYSKDETPDYFTLLGQPGPAYKVDLASLSRNMKQLQRRLHPDLFGNRSKEEQEVSQDLSSFVNQAIVTLQNPIERALYLLSLQGIHIDLESQQTQDREFLSEVLELNEELEALNSKEEWIQFQNRNQNTLKLLEEKLAGAFDRNDFEDAQRVLVKMKYYETMGLKLKELQNKFNIVH